MRPNLTLTFPGRTGNVPGKQRSEKSGPGDLMNVAGGESPGDGSPPDPPDELISGTVTILFTDIEGSTRLVERLGDRYAEVLATHRRLLRAAFRALDGRTVDTSGDAHFVVFRRAGDALKAAVTAQRVLAQERWPEGVSVRVRMGLHTGQPTLVRGTYTGIDVHRAARLCAAAHGGQMLLSQATRDLVSQDLPADVTLRDLGEHHLKDLQRPERVFQLVIADLPSAFPSLRSRDSRLNNLPVQTTPLIGRESELKAGQVLLLREDVRLLSVTGPPGAGKTRLGLQIAADLSSRFADGVCFVPLAPITDPQLLPSTIAHALGIQEGGDRPLEIVLEDYLREKHLLLVLDNFEQILAGARLVADLLTTAPGLKVLTTSRAPLRLRAEHELLVPPLALPDLGLGSSAAALEEYPAVALFIDRAAAIQPGLTLTEADARAVAEICNRLDGLPLAIELAAARIKLLPPQAMLKRVGRWLPLLIGGPRDLPARQQALRGAIAWSYDLLDEADRRLFRRLSVFVGGCTLQAAERVCGPEETSVMDSLASLVEKNLVRPDVRSGDELGIGMLETIREYGLEQLEAHGELSTLRDRHLDYFLALAEEADPALLGPHQVAWCHRLESERGNIRAALEWALAASDQPAGVTAGLTRAPSRPEAGVRIADALEQFWMLRGHSREHWSRVSALIGQAPAGGPVKASILVVAGYLAHCLREHDVAVGLADEGLALWRKIGDPRGMAVAMARRGVMAIWQGDHRQAEALLTEARALFRQTGGEAASGVEHPIAAFLAQAVQEQGDYGRAEALYEESLTEAQARGDRHAAAYSLRHLARLCLRRGETTRASALIGRGVPPLMELRDRRCTPPTLEALAYALAQRQPGDATRLFAAAQAIRDQSGMRLMRTEEQAQERERATLEMGLGQAAFATAWSEGRAMTLEQALTYALKASSARSASVSGQSC
jgi:predicted ATPase/class 3 adenylate cyclase